MTRAILDDHLLRDLLADHRGERLDRLLEAHEPATTNLFLHRLCRSVVSARGGALTGAWEAEQRRELGRRLLTLPRSIEIVPIRVVARRMAVIADGRRVSAMFAVGGEYRTISR